MLNPEALKIFEYSGTARSGKGSIVSWLSEVHPDVATDETGADYRAVTLGLLHGGKLEPFMPGDAVATVLSGLEQSAVVDMAARRRELVQELGLKALYTDDVHSVLSKVSQSDMVRQAVKDGFKQRVKKVRDAGEHQHLLVDGRNLAPVVRGIAHTELVLRTFVYCSSPEAAMRECLRQGLTPGTKEWSDAFPQAYDLIMQRNNDDKNRGIDPVKPEDNSIDYWRNQSLLDHTAETHARFLFDGDITAAMLAIFNENRDYTDIPRSGAGLKAVKEDRQIEFDTTPFRSYSNSKHAMLLAANTMFEEATRAHEILCKTI